jgi:cell division septum initiation protein DivIVA
LAVSAEIAQWDQDFRDNIVWSAIEEILETLHNAPISTDDEANKVDRLTTTLKMLLGYRESSALLINPTMISSFQETITNGLRVQVNAWAQNHAIGHLNNAMANLWSVLDFTKGWNHGKRENLTQAAAALRESTRASKRYIEQLREEIEQTGHDFTEQVESLKQTINEQDVELTQLVDALNTRLKQTDTKVTDVETRADNLVNQLQTRFDETEATRRESFQKFLDDINDDNTTAFQEIEKKNNEFLNAQVTYAKEVNSQIDAIKTEAESVLGAVSTTATFKWYKDYADQEKKTADWLRLAAIGFLLLTFTVSFLWITYLDHSNDTVKETIFKSTLSISLAAIATYAIKESSMHRGREEAARKNELILRALVPFIDSIDTNKKEEVIIQTAHHLFMSEVTLPVPSQ